MTKAGYRVISPDELKDLYQEEQEFAYQVLIGLSERPKRLPSRFFYDDEGSRLFQQIMELEEYYPTDCEREILTRYSGELADLVADRPVDVIDLGAGDGAKTMTLLEHFARRNLDFRYIPIDISEQAMKTVVAETKRRLPQLPVNGLVSEYIDGVQWMRRTSAGRMKLVLFLGSNIGNFERPLAREFLQRVWSALDSGDRLLLGFDLKKDIDVLLSAYNDKEGVTAAFNLNLLARMNRELGADFDLAKFQHYGTFDVLSGAMRSYLVSLEPQSVWVEALRQRFEFAAWEPIHTEYSYKYLRSDVVSLAKANGFRIEAEFLDERNWFVSSLWTVDKGR